VTTVQEQLSRSAEGAAQATVLVVDDHALVRTGVANIISHEPDLQVVAEAANGVEAIAAFERFHPDVTLLDLRMPVMEASRRCGRSVCAIPTPRSSS
jgi:two-component system NarL family response regulator